MSSKEPRRQPRRSGAGRVHSPTREKILTLIETHTDGVSLNWVAQHLGLHENTVRAHLEALHADGYLSRSLAAASGRGRPAWIWTPAQSGPSPFAQLASALAGQIAAASADPAAEAIAAGRRWASSLAGANDLSQSTDPVLRSLEELGFSPEANAGGSLTLRSCPLLSAVADHQQIVCNVHLGMVRGLAEAQGADAGGIQLHPFAGENRGCILNMNEPAGKTR
ncbi:transcriptional regulator [Glutamicibacter uratoxydans]|uniref:Transcriptional regulator n=1 Tax=Glutamicibacter uratoxydans TaxID=43667 RepID=A0A4Y4DQ84_GLUUR|nr:helix-turn-helix domain-containing protein [Glutamicibacter uratoxydans]GED07086.1 transcriptional regulator [Glutamicibacter uratoxydans]